MSSLLARASLGLCLLISVLHASEPQAAPGGLRVPEGFRIERVAGPPLVDRPITADFDEQGRLYVADSSGSNERVQKQLETRPHRIVRLTDTDGDGHFDSRTVFADRMMFPEGTLWHDGSLYVSAPPSIWKLTDTDDDGVADRREEWLHQTLTGCANDLHGPYGGPDGWIYWCKGAWAEQTHPRESGPPLVTKAAHIFRRRPEGGEVEPVMTGGMDNPVDVTFTAEGERVFTTTFFEHPRGGRRDGLLHAVYGGVYGKENSRIGPQQRTGELMPVLTHLGAAAPCGFTRYRSGAFGEEYRSNLFACLFNMRKVTRHVLVPDGATFRTVDEDFVVSDDVDFHPTDVLEDADGSLLVIDTGGWYKLCCPTSQLYKPDVLGAVYRIRRKGALSLPDARGVGLAWGELSDFAVARLLGDERVAVRDRAVATLAARGGPVLTALERVLGGAQGDSTEEVDVRRRALWVASRIDASPARAWVRKALRDPSESVRQAAAHVVSVWRDRQAVPELLELLQGDSAHNRRVAAEALGRVGNASAVDGLLAAAADDTDRVLEHSLTYALIEIGEPAATRRGLVSNAPGTRRAALVALDQMAGGDLAADDVRGLLDHESETLREAALWILAGRPEWGEELVEFLRARLRGITEEGELAVVEQLTRYLGGGAVQAMVAAELMSAETTARQRVALLQCMQRAGLRDLPAGWLEGLYASLEHENAEVLQAAAQTARVLHVPEGEREELSRRLRALGERGDVPAALRLEALAGAPHGLRTVDEGLFGFLLEHLPVTQPISMRGNAAGALSQASLSGAQLQALAEALPQTGALEVNRVLVAFEQSKDPKIGTELLRRLEASPTRAGVRVDLVQRLVKAYGPAVDRQAAALYRALQVDPEEQQRRLEGLLKQTRGGDVARGHSVFQSAKAGCRACHELGYLGGQVGPDLSRIGRVRSERDLLEAIVFPNASFVRSYEPITVVTTGGAIHNGVVRHEDAREILLATGAEERVRVLRSEVLELRASSVSVMPSGLDQQLSLQELADLVAFLKAAQ